MNRFVHRFRILNRDVLIESDSADFIRMFDMDYRRFRYSTSQKPRSTRSYEPASSIGNGGRWESGRPPARFGFAVLLHEQNHDPLIRCSGRSFSLAGYPNKEQYAYRFVMERIIGAMDEFFMLHAGVVSRNGKALILAGPPGTGKTTMVLELLKQRFSFCSDDYAPIQKTTGLVHPFPRSPWTGDYQHTAGKESAPLVREEKRPLDPEALGYHIEKSPLQIAAVLCLAGVGISDDDREFRIELTWDNEEIIRELLSLKHVRAERVDTAYPVWRIRYPFGDGLAAQMRKIMEEFKDQIRHAYRLYPRHRFSKKAKLSPISSHEAAFRLICDLKRDMSISGNDENRSPAPLGEMMALSVLLDSVPCYRLSLGTKASMLEKINQVTGNWMLDTGTRHL
jgi:hypothetical protein